jgi:glycogen(starch) synthase
MEGRLPNEWERPLDYGQVKGEIGVGPLDRLLLFVGPLEHAAGVDLLLEALPVLLGRAGNLRLAYVGMGYLHGSLEHRAHELGVAHAVRLLGHVEGPRLVRLLRAAEALVLPSRYRVPFDDAVVDLARRARRPVVTTHGGPAHLVRHEETGIITYDNPGSMVWAVDRILGDPAHAERMGQNGRRGDGSQPSWGEVARHYLELCAACFPELTVTAE